VGRVLVFSRSEGAGWAWQQTLTLEPPYNVSDSNFGKNVILDGGDLIVHSYYTDNQGAAWVFRRAGGAWAPTQKLTSRAPATNAYFGGSMALRAGTLAIGATDELYIYKRAGGQWVEQARMVPGTLGICCWGRDDVAVDDDGATVVVSARTYFEDDGAVFVYTKTGPGGAWAEHQVLRVAKGDYEQMGFRVAMDGGVIMATARGVAAPPGCVYAFTRSGANWTLASQLLPPAFTGVNFATEAIAFSGGMAVVGDPSYLTSVGAVFLYTWNGTRLVPKAPSGVLFRFSSADFGAAVALSTGNAGAHCDTLVVGAPYVDGPGDSGGVEYQGGMTAFPM
jgi:hypothetical protein